MSYFQDNYGSVKLPIAGPDGAGGLRNAQLGAIHAIASHFTVENRPALAVLPTGAGKTAVLMVSAFLLRATRVLVITPSTLVREQIAGKFAELDPLRALAVIPETLGTPRVIEVKKRMETPADWEAVRDFDVIVSTPNCVSAAQERVCAPPPGLFDLLLIDEAHHSPAKTWQALLDQFSGRESAPGNRDTLSPRQEGDQGEIRLLLLDQESASGRHLRSHRVRCCRSRRGGTR
jgi:superfamily II DNA or RNA helicase